MYQTNQAENEAFFAMVLPAFLEYVRQHAATVEGVELATSLQGISSMQCLQELGGVVKVVRVPLSMMTYNVSQAEQRANDAADAADAAAGRANTAASNANDKAALVTEAVLDIAAEKAAATAAAQNANGKADLANSIYQTVKAWYESVNPAWSTWFTATQSDWTTWFNARKAEWPEWYNGIKSAYETWVAAAQQAETARQTAEATRQGNESTRQTQETTRQGNETTRQGNETTRQNQEATRVGNETTRQNNESTRQTQEGTRESNESSRQSAERSRVSAENERESAEDDRVEEFSRLKTESQAATSSANNAALAASTQAGRAAQAAENANAEAQNLSGLKTDCLNATGAAQSAAQNAGEKMTEIDALVKTINGESSAAPVRMTVSVLDTISTKNKEQQRVKVQLYPTYVMQNVLYQKVSGSSVMVNPSGVIIVTGTGESVFWIIPPQNTELWQQVSVTVRGPRVRLSRSGKMRLNGGRIRIV